MKLIVTIVQDEDGMFIAECPSIPGCVSQGRTEDEAAKNIREAIRECLEVRAEQGLPLTVTTREVEVPARCRPSQQLKSATCFSTPACAFR
jgi:predicted RNase H-like HicB family nuclease